MTVRTYYSTDSGAPVYSGSVGAFIAVLKACLVDGYGSKAAAGWTQEFSGTNLSVLRPAAGNRRPLWIDDTNAQYARVRGHEGMTAVSTGTGPFPTDAQLSGGCYVVKSNAASSAARGWVVVADEKRCWVVSAQVADTIAGSAAAGFGTFFGDFISAKAGDAFNTLLIAGNTSTTSGNQIGTLSNTMPSVGPGHFIPRSYTQTGASITAGKHTDHAKAGGVAVVGTGGSSFPDPVTGGIGIAPLFVHEPVAGVVRGIIPGGWCPAHNLPGNPGDTFQGSGALAGKEFLLVDVSSGGTRGRMALETSNTWE